MTSGDDLFSRHASPLRGKARRPGIKNAGPLPYISAVAFALCFSLSLRHAGDPPCPHHAERSLFVPQRRSACQHRRSLTPTATPDWAAPWQNASKYPWGVFGESRVGQAHDQAPDQPPAANPFRVTPRPSMARRAAPALKMPVSIFTYTFVFPRRRIFSTVGSRRLFDDRSAGRGMASPDRPTARPSRRNRAGGGNVQEKDALRGAQDTKEDAYGDDERGA